MLSSPNNNMPTEVRPRLLSPKTKNESKLNKISDFEEKIIVDLKMKGLSLNEIADHMKHVHKVKIKPKGITKIVIRHGEEGEKMNQRNDRLVADKIQIAETDEIYQGRDGMFIGTVDKSSTYLMNLSQFSGKNHDEFVSTLRSVSDRFPRIEIMITDGFPTYVKAVNEALPNATHINCHVHAYRDIMREQDVYNRRANRAYSSLRECRLSLSNKRRSLKHNQKMVERYRLIMKQKITERDNYYQQHGIKNYSKKKGSKKVRHKFNDDIGFNRSCMKVYQKGVDSWVKKIKKAEKEEENLENEYQAKKNEALQVGRFVMEFKQLLDCKYDEYEKKRENLMDKLSRSSIPLAKSIRKTLEHKPQIFADKTESIQLMVPANHANTNTIESVFGKYRLFFRKYRRITQSRLSNAIFQLLRLKHNLSRPYTGFNNTQSPLQRLGVQTKYHNYLEALFPTLN